MRLLNSILFPLFIGSSLMGCAELACSSKETSRATSPDGRVDAVVVERDCGATTRVATRVQLVPKGREVSGDKGLVFVADELAGFELRWIEQSKLELRYTAARIFQFTNFWMSRDLDNFNYVVRIAEKEAS